MNWLRWRRFFEASPQPASTSSFTRQRQSFLAANTVVRCFYGALLFMAVGALPESISLLDKDPLRPLWPVAWLAIPALKVGPLLIIAGVVLGNLAALLWLDRRWARTLAAIGWLEFAAYINSFGKISHGYHLCLLISWLLILLPKGWGTNANRQERQKFLLVVWSCQALVFMTYTMSGIGKVALGLYQLLRGEPNAFQTSALPAHIASRLLETNVQSLLGPWLIDHPHVAQVFFLSDIYLQVFSLSIAFRPELHRVWGALLVLFHVMTYLTMTIAFSTHVLQVALLLMASPFAPLQTRWPAVLENLPVFGTVTRRLVHRRTS